MCIRDRFTSEEIFWIFWHKLMKASLIIIISNFKLWWFKTLVSFVKLKKINFSSLNAGTIIDNSNFYSLGACLFKILCKVLLCILNFLAVSETFLLHCIKTLWICSHLTLSAVIILEGGGGKLSFEAVSYTHLTLPTICSV